MSRSITFDELPNMVQQMLEQLQRIEHQLDMLGYNHSSDGGSEQIMTVKEAATFLNLAVPTVYSMVSRRQLPFHKRTKRVYFFKSELLKYVQDGRKLTIDEIKEQTHLHIKKRS